MITVTYPDRQTQVLNIVGTTFYCMAFENHFRGILGAVGELQQTKPNNNILAKIIILCNLLFIGKYVIDAVKLFGPVDWQREEFEWQFAYSTSYHVSMIAFGWFLLYKCWMVSSQNRIVFVLGALLLANRWAWTITDLAFARLDCSSAGGCMYTENLTTIIGSQVSDVAIDIFCTMAVLIGCQYHLRSDIRGLFLVIMEENVVRSTFLFVYGCVTIWVYVTFDQESEVLSFIYFYFQAYVYAVALNSEFYFKELRQKAVDPILIAPSTQINIRFDLESQKE